MQKSRAAIHKTILVFLTLVALSMVGRVSKAQEISPEQACPDMNGHYRHEQFLATADMVVTQTGCQSMRVRINAKIFGATYTEDVQSLLDGVSRPLPSQNQNEKDMISARFVNDTVVFILDKTVKQSNGSTTHSVNMMTGTLNGPSKMETTLSDVDAQGKPVNTQQFEFLRVN